MLVLYCKRGLLNDSVSYRASDVSCVCWIFESSFSLLRRVIEVSFETRLVHQDVVNCSVILPDRILSGRYMGRSFFFRQTSVELDCLLPFHTQVDGSLAVCNKLGLVELEHSRIRSLPRSVVAISAGH